MLEFVKYYCFQAVSDLEKGWTVGSKEAHAKLMQLKQKGNKMEVKSHDCIITQDWLIYPSEIHTGNL